MTSHEHQPERRHQAKEKDTLFRLINAIHLFGWAVMLAALIVFHYARPEFTTGFQEYLGIEVREQWSRPLTHFLLLLLAACTSLGLVVTILKRKRTRRKHDDSPYSGLVLLIVALLCLAALVAEVPWLG